MRMPSRQFYFYQPAAVIRVTGEDAFSFLQGQFTNELRQGGGAITYGLWLNQKGKVLADSQVLKQAENDFLMFSVSSGAATLVQRLEQYIIADDVSLSDETAKMQGLALWGEGCGEALKTVSGLLPVLGQFLQKEALVIFPGRRTDGENYEIIGPELAVDEWRRLLGAQGWVEATGFEAECARISSGIPAIPQDIGPTDLPNEAGLETTAISYTKGCYLGQEVMARLKNLGQVRRQLCKVHGRGEPPQTGTALFQGMKKVGEIRSAVLAGEGFIAMAMLTRMGLDENAGFSYEPADQSPQTPVVWMS